MNRLLNQNEIVNQFPAMYKSTLIIRDDVGEDYFQPVSYHFGYHFVPNIA